jgi:hypothetical protein
MSTEEAAAPRIPRFGRPRALTVDPDGRIRVPSDFDPDRAERLEQMGYTIVWLDKSEVDLTAEELMEKERLTSQ